MVIFISSVRRGLEEERDSLPPLISALGHVPKRFEDFSALPVPPRKACLDGVASADAYVLMLGEHYGDPLPDTGLAPTEEEFNAAVRKGIPIIVLRKKGVTMDEAQARFAERVEAYETGRFRDSFASPTDMLAKAAAAIRALESGPLSVEQSPVTEPVPVPWLGEYRNLPGRSTYGALLEVHLLPLAATRLPATALEGAGQRLVRAGREGGVLDEDQAISKGESADAVWAGTAAGGQEVRPAGLRLDRSGAVSIWRELPRDQMGTLVSVDSLANEIVELTRVAASIVPGAGQIAITAGLDPVGSLMEGDPAALGSRNSATLRQYPGKDGIRLPPEAAVQLSQLGAAAGDLSRELAVRLLRQHRAP